MTKLLEAQRNANQTMVAHMNASTAAQETQSVALAQLVENSCEGASRPTGPAHMQQPC